jgi:hypothetical protein
MKRTIMYKRTLILIDAPKIKYCECCLKKQGKEIKKLDTHHWRYEFTSKEVKANPKLVLKNTSVLCFRCHRVADALRICHENPLLTEKLNELRSKAVS